MAPVSKILNGLGALRRDNPWPEFGYGEIEPFYLPLDNGGRGGRELITDIIKSPDIDVMVEIGCFLCGSTLQWLRTSSKLTVIGCDPWDSNWGIYIEQMALDPRRARTTFHLSDEQIATIVQNVRKYGNFCVAMNNVRLYKDRFIPVRRRAPEVLTYLHDRQIEPKLIYIDADKKREDLDVARELFPNAIICGDDWLWPDESGVLRMQEHVKAFALEHNYEIQSSRQTWLLIAPQGSKRASETTEAARLSTDASAGETKDGRQKTVEDELN
jgi:hypothetical protein